MKSFEMINRKQHTQNNLKEIMNKNNWTSYYVSKFSGVDRKTISKIKNDEFSVISSDTLLSIAYNLKINLNDLVNPVNSAIKLHSTIQNFQFNELLGDILHKYTNMYFTINPYNNNHCVNVYSKYLHKFHFRGNFRINCSSNNSPTLQITDFDLDFDKEYKRINIKNFTNKMLIAIEDYSKKLGIKCIEHRINLFCRNQKSENYMIYSNGDNLMLNTLIKNKYIECKFKNKYLIISNSNELLSKCNNDFDFHEFLLSKKIN
ncbi:helix-turn-helix domain-containing protein [Apilactobacillus timberlakei]|uniref:XRE family transcriptional regulator n=1 Tax=Apilactobacillus timberlakei TaxID=2008380 RepID=A0ABY2YVE1_9LACO|nr:helix-turn-helix transcriptional regulator [Apilactobacillus timberlakei]TPR14893.1 XRE family transcriptional regulator [Apilactobacillus timberlakei]TPR15863.1 XRE family transcriptional regulator [Apilactobacillus timberlakei]TPR16224.1 XRE family transcriptional regulator [Apilactobacillus timberlakei]